MSKTTAQARQGGATAQLAPDARRYRSVRHLCKGDCVTRRKHRRASPQCHFYDGARLMLYAQTILHRLFSCTHMRHPREHTAQDIRPRPNQRIPGSRRVPQGPAPRAERLHLQQCGRVNMKHVVASRFCDTGSSRRVCNVWLVDRTHLPAAAAAEPAHRQRQTLHTPTQFTTPAIFPFMRAFGCMWVTDLTCVLGYSHRAMYY